MNAELETPKHAAALVSVIMPCRNGAKTLGQAIDSVLKQEYEHLELIIIDDGSEDESRAIIKAYQSLDSRIIGLFNEVGGGVASARNQGLAEAKGRFVAFLDCDDYWLPGSLGSRVECCLREDAKIVYGPYLRLLPRGQMVFAPVPPRLTLGHLLTRNYIGNLTGLFDAKYFGAVGQRSMPHEDYIMWCELLRQGGSATATNLDRPLGVYRVSEDSLSGNKFKAAVWHWQALRKGLGIPFLRALRYQTQYLWVSVISRVLERAFPVKRP